jgi:hypothetical protein
MSVISGPEGVGAGDVAGEVWPAIGGRASDGLGAR